MSALGILARAGSTRGAELCPHPARLESCAIQVSGRRRLFICCPSCLQTFQRLIAEWHGGQINLREVGAQMFALGYSRGDVVRFQLQLLKDKIRVRVGLLREVDL